MYVFMLRLVNNIGLVLQVFMEDLITEEEIFFCPFW